MAVVTTLAQTVLRKIARLNSSPNASMAGIVVALVPLLWTADEFSLSQRVQGFVAAPMWPHGDPTAMWLQ